MTTKPQTWDPSNKANQEIHDTLKASRGLGTVKAITPYYCGIGESAFRGEGILTGADLKKLIDTSVCLSREEKLALYNNLGPILAPDFKFQVRTEGGRCASTGITAVKGQDGGEFKIRWALEAAKEEGRGRLASAAADALDNARNGAYWLNRLVNHAARRDDQAVFLGEAIERVRVGAVPDDKEIVVALPCEDQEGKKSQMFYATPDTGASELARALGYDGPHEVHLVRGEVFSELVKQAYFGLPANKVAAAYLDAYPFKFHYDPHYWDKASAIEKAKGVVVGTPTVLLATEGKAIRVEPYTQVWVLDRATGVALQFMVTGNDKVPAVGERVEIKKAIDKATGRETAKFKSLEKAVALQQ